jgi:hypothetical protein
MTTVPPRLERILDSDAIAVGDAVHCDDTVAV